MTLITGPKRAFGIGELKQQNAVIKVYTVNEFKNAITKILASPSGIGTVQIAGNLILTEPLKLPNINSVFGNLANIENKPSQITIECINGTKILNGRSINSTYTVTDNIVFDMGDSINDSYPTITYIFKNLNINNISNLPFRALCQWNCIDSTVGLTLPTARSIYILDINLINVNYIFDARNTSVTEKLTLYNCNINNCIYGIDISGQFLNINSNEVSINSSNFNNFFADSSIAAASPVQFNVVDGAASNIFSNFPYYIEIVLADTSIGSGIIINAASSSYYPRFDSWTIISDSNYNSVQLGQVLQLNGPNQGGLLTNTEYTKLFNIVQPAGGTNLQDLRLQGPTIPIPTPEGTRYNIETTITIYIAGSVNTYKFISGVKITSAGVISILSTSTIYAVEEYISTTLTGIAPTLIGGLFAISPTDSANAIKIDGTFRVTGFGQDIIFS